MNIKKKINESKQFVIFITIAMTGYNLIYPLPERIRGVLILFVLVSFILIFTEETKQNIMKDMDFRWFEDDRTT